MMSIVCDAAAGQSYKNVLQNYVQGRGETLPDYRPIVQLSGAYVELSLLAESDGNSVMCFVPFYHISDYSLCDQATCYAPFTVLWV